ncbi:hypothetical protein GCM10007940_10960 [Portibacter lacus]|uniref:Peptidase S8/S53 domain-containing protein n=1 Tax=Portibacter lacus TaxID=1099794 RepID=A0AA37WCF7_9BACT|nr:hypothetical protein GCM10007940_10960 [Portibacter lacus]
MATDAERFYYYNGEKIPLNINKNKLLIYYQSDSELDQSIFDNNKIEQDIRVPISQSEKGIYAKIIELPSNSDYSSEIQKLEILSSVISVEVVLGDSMAIPVSNNFYVKLRNEQDSTSLQLLAKNTRTKILRKVSFSKEWYVLEADKNSISDCIGVSNIFTESNLFEKVDPGFIFNISPNGCPSDAQINNQWAIDGSGIDINACCVWDVTTTGSSGVVIAVIDEGIAQNHVEFSSGTFTSASYHTQNGGSSPAQLVGVHGTQMAGVIAADHNASQIAGVAPDLKIMNISHDLFISSTISEELAAGVNFAVSNNADIINCSWSDQGGQYYTQYQSAMLEDAIDNALDNICSKRTLNSILSTYE